MNIALEIPEKVLQQLKREAEAEDKTIEEFILEMLMERADADDPETRSEIHFKLSQKYWSEAEDFLQKKDPVQASEKAWGAAAQMVKAVAAKRGEKLRSHSRLNEFLDVISEEMKDPELDRFWRSALALHQNFYESWLPPRSVERGIEDVKRLLEKLRSFG